MGWLLNPERKMGNRVYKVDFRPDHLLWVPEEDFMAPKDVDRNELGQTLRKLVGLFYQWHPAIFVSKLQYIICCG